MRMNIRLQQNSYPIFVEKGALYHLTDFLDLDRKVFLVTDSGIPAYYAEVIADQCQEACVYTLPQGEESKSLENFQLILSSMLAQNWSRSDCVLSIGGGVCGDLAGFVASSYMRGIDFYNIPTSLLSQIDASIGGKTAVNLSGVKNIVGAFYQPKAVVIDPNHLQTLTERQFNNGMAEAIKMAACLDPELYDFLVESEVEEVKGQIDYVILACLRAKKKIVEEDEKEAGLRRVLNFGHTVGHAIEANSNFYHGEAVACGMTYFASPAVKQSLLPLLDKYSLPNHTHIPADTLYQSIRHDKKVEGDQIYVVELPEIGHFIIEELPIEKILEILQLGNFYNLVF